MYNILELSVLAKNKNKIKIYLHFYQTKIINKYTSNFTKFETLNQ